MDSDLPPQQEIVSQSEVEGLLAQISGGGDVNPKAEDLVSTKISHPSEARQYMFRQLSTFSTSELRKLRLRHEDFIRALSARLSIHLRLEVSLKMSRLETMPFNKFIDELSNPTHLALLKLEPLNGMCLLDISPQLGLAVIDRELGGKGVCSEDERGLTEIEVRILNRAVELTASEWCSTWSSMLDLRPVLVGYESSGSFVQSFAMDTPMLILGIEMQIGELMRPMHFGFPYSTLEPLIKKINASVPGSKEPAEKRPAIGAKWNPVFDDVNLRVSAVLPNLKITAREVATMKSGDVIPLDPEILQHLRVSLAQKPKFLATMGRCGPRWAAKITKVLDA